MKERDNRDRERKTGLYERERGGMGERERGKWEGKGGERQRKGRESGVGDGE